MRLRLYLVAPVLALCAAISARGAETAWPTMKADSLEYFDMQIAPMLAQHCLECHDAATKKGKLDLSRRDTAFAGGKHGQAIAPGKPAESMMWRSVESDEMPDERPPLSAEEKRLLREWIEAGAVWSANEIDPLAHRGGGRAGLNWVRRLTVPEYVETVRSAAGVDIAKEAAERLPPDVRADGFQHSLQPEY